MKKYFILVFALAIGFGSFAQKKELKELEKAVNSNNYASAKAALASAEGFVSAMDDKSKGKFYFLKAKALYANGAGSDADVTAALESFNKLETLENTTGKKVYSSQANNMKVTMANSFVEKAQKALGEKNYKSSTSNFESAYRVSPADTLFLFNAALLATSDKNFDKALTLYNELSDLGYTGIATEYLATEVESGEEQTFPNKSLRDISVKAGTHNASRNQKSESKSAEIAKNVALIYIEQGNNDKALEAIEVAKLQNPDDFNLIVAEANVRYKLGETDRYQALVKKALELEPDNVDLLFNLGVVASEAKDLDEAKKYYDAAINLDPTYTRAYMNMAAMILDQEEGIIEEMNGLGASAADDKRYEELKDERTQLYKNAVPYLTSVLDNEPENLSAARTLMNIYSALDDTDNYEKLKTLVAEIETGN